jgi:predicted dienelactone hydrolase
MKCRIAAEVGRVILLLMIPTVLAGCSEHEERAVPVGRLHLALEDPDRTNWAGTGARPIAATVWYPAAAGSSETEWRAGPFRFGRSALEAPFADGVRRPLILLSHGTGGSAAQLSWLAEQLVGRGFLVAAVSHHGNTAAERRQWPAGFVLPGERVRDLSLLLDRLLDHQELGQRIDPDRIGAAGFSLGGYTALALTGANIPFEQWRLRCQPVSEDPFCRLPPEAGFSLSEVRSAARSDSSFRAGIKRSVQPVIDERIRAIYAIAPALIPLMEDPPDGNHRLPIRVILADSDEQVPRESTEAAVRRLFPQAAVAIVSAGHYTFLARCGFWRGIMVPLCRDPSGVVRTSIHQVTANDAATFFDQAL